MRSRLGIATTLAAFALSATTLLHAHLSGPPPGHTGAPGEGTCADAGCHNVSSGVNGILEILNTGPQHIDTVALRVFFAGPSLDHWGFQLTVLDSLDQPYGEILVRDSVRMGSMVDSAGRTYLFHTAAGAPGGGANFTVWDFYWIRPTGADFADSFYVFASGVMADGDGTPQNDAVETSLSVGPICIIDLPGDVNLTGTVTSADITRLVRYVFGSGDYPQPCEANGDVNCSGAVNAADVITLVNYVFKGADPPCDICADSSMDCTPNL